MDPINLKSHRGLLGLMRDDTGEGAEVRGDGVEAPKNPVESFGRIASGI